MHCANYSKHMKWTSGNFYIYINLGGLFASIITPVLRNSYGGDSFTVVFAVGASTFFSASGNCAGNYVWFMSFGQPVES